MGHQVTISLSFPFFQLAIKLHQGSLCGSAGQVYGHHAITCHFLGQRVAQIRNKNTLPKALSTISGDFTRNPKSYF